ncbi:LAFE_0F12442g1_1 [Lachancea fermentati]|uniref:Ribosome-recycling factor, mitochondrial n=1 Tax=Lachancea fermentati TaxID=4955 RepID=A0A1G4MFK2_LACFM|nr:LAFE_0F12442g1_1 [Lachancea fermentati]
MLPFVLGRQITPSYLQATRLFNCSAISAKKVKKGGKGKTAEVEEDVEVVDVKQYVKQATDEFNSILELHKRKLGELKVGTANPSIFNALKVGKNNAKFTDVATTSLKGRNNLIVTVFDPKDTKSVVSSILGAGLNLNPERIPDNEQQLKVALPPPTTESRKQTCKQLKAVFEEFKNSSSKQSLGHVRGEILKQLKKLDKKNDSVTKIIQEIERLHKDSTNKLQEQLKQAEKNVLG